MVTTRSPDKDDLRAATLARARATARRSPAYSFPYLPIRGELAGSWRGVD